MSCVDRISGGNVSFRFIVVTDGSEIIQAAFYPGTIYLLSRLVVSKLYVIISLT